MNVILFICVYVAFIIERLLHAQFIQRRFSSLSFQQLISELEPVSRDDITSGRPQHGSSELESIRRIKQNCPVMIALALYCDTWCPQCCTEAVIAMRNHEMNVQKAVKRYKASTFFRLTEPQSLNYGKIASEYCKLVQCLLDLYKDTHVARYPQIRVACD